MHIIVRYTLKPATTGLLQSKGFYRILLCIINNYDSDILIFYSQILYQMGENGQVAITHLKIYIIYFMA